MYISRYFKDQGLYGQKPIKVVIASIGFCFALLWLGFPLSALASGLNTGQIARPVVAIVIDDIGDNLENGERAILLPYALTYSFLPHTQYSLALARLAEKKRKEIMLHLPMEPMGDEAMGPGGLQLEMEREVFVRTLHDDMQSLPHFVGINNHMGSRLTRFSVPMRWLMEELSRVEDVYFVDSFTTTDSVAYETAREYSIPTLTRDVFLDHNRNFSDMPMQFARLLAIARKHGTALAIAHPHNDTLEFLDRMLAELPHQGFQLVPVSQLIEFRKRRNTTWRASLSLLPKDLKN
ncbi:MAG: divergent polysaccharide deacetylase family protein [Gammaproteobacteria bacterium]|nr:divergent polysaccharide deacetylase family protein [Gammaproteobacteria bacterium]